MNNGVIAFIPPWKCIHRPVREMNIKKFGVKQENFSVIQEEEVM